MGNSKINRRVVLKSVLFVGCGLLIPGSAKAGNIHSLKGSVFINKEGEIVKELKYFHEEVLIVDTLNIGQ